MNIKPSYYDSFRCIADKCPLTCCMQWKIAVDDKTKRKWNTKYFQGKTLSSYIIKKEGADVIGLNEEKVCPFLNEDKLCSLVTEYGSEILSATCDIFPRQVHTFADRTEYSLVCCCPAVVDMLHDNGKISFIYEKDKFRADSLFYIRKMIMELVSNEGYSSVTAFLMGYYILSDIYEKWGEQEIQTDCLDEYTDDKFLQTLYDVVEGRKTDFEGSFQERNELWLDIEWNYGREGLYTSYIEEISQKAREISEGNSQNAVQLSEIYRQFQEEIKIYEPLFRNFLLSELFTSLLIPDADILSMVVKMQWIAMEYTAIYHAVFLKWITEGRKLTYNNVRNYIVVVSRMMGYDEDDIYEYLENSFESLVWEWGYMAFILGK